MDLNTEEEQLGGVPGRDRPCVHMASCMCLACMRVWGMCICMHVRGAQCMCEVHKKSMILRTGRCRPWALP